MTRISKPKRPPWLPEKENFNANNYKFYNSHAWRKHAKRFLKITGNQLCRICESEGITTLASQVDHIVPIDQGGEKWSYDNLQPVCKRCNMRKAAKRSNEKI